MKFPSPTVLFTAGAALFGADLFAEGEILSSTTGLSPEWSQVAWGELKSGVTKAGDRQALRVAPQAGKTIAWAGASVQPNWNQSASFLLPLTPEDLAAGALTLKVNSEGAGGQKLQFAVTLAGPDGKEFDTKGFIPFERVSNGVAIDADPATWQLIRIPFATVLAKSGLTADKVAGVRKLALQIMGDAPADAFLLTDIGVETGDPIKAAAAKNAAAAIAALPDLTLEVGTGDANWNHVVGQPLRFTVKLASGKPVTVTTEVRYRLGYEKFESAPRTLTVPPEGATVDFGAPTKPGFIRLEVTADIAGKPVKKIATAAVSPEQLRPTQIEPADFDAFWADGKSRLAAVPADPQLTPKPELSGPAFDAYELSLATYDPTGNAPRFYGILCVPKGPGPFPAILQTPGAGVRSYKGEIWVPRDQFITLEVGIHGIPVTEPGKFYTEQTNGPLKDYQTRDLVDREKFYYRRVYLGVLRSLDYLTTHPKWDGKNLVIRGGSQGGQLAIVGAALEPRVTAVAAAFPAFCDVTGYLNGRAGGWPGLFNGTPSSDEAAKARRAAQIATTGYYDTVNFARRITVPAFFAQGYNDDVCPPTGFFAMYSVVSAPKELHIFKEAFHNLPGDGWGLYSKWVIARAKSVK